MSTMRLPVSGIEVILRPPTGAEDMLLVEAPVYDTAFALEFIARLASSVNGVAVEWATLCVTDLDALLLLLRHMIFGDLIRTDIVCPTQGCGKRIDIAFRIREYATATKPLHALIQRCIRPAGIPARLVKRVETAMETLAPSLSDNLQGQCLECSMTIDMYFDIQQFVLSELRNQATFIYEDVHLLAKHYHWTQAEILSLPRSRRTRYTEMLQQERSLV